MQNYSNTRTAPRFGRRATALVAASLCLWPATGAPPGDEACAVKLGRVLTVYPGCTYRVQGDEAYNDVVVLGNGVVEIPSDASLTVRRLLDFDPLGKMKFSGDEVGRPGRFVVSNQLEMLGEIMVSGRAGGGIRLHAETDHLKIQGKVSVTSGPLTLDVLFENNGKLLVDGPYALTVRQAAGPESKGCWVVEHPEGSIVIATHADADITATTGHVVVSAGVFHVQGADFLTDSGVFVDARGRIVVEDGFRFEATGEYDPTECD